MVPLVLIASSLSSDIWETFVQFTRFMLIPVPCSSVASFLIQGVLSVPFPGFFGLF